MRPGRTLLPGFIVLEGIDGTGTTTQLARLGQRLRGLGRAASIGCEPTPGPVGRLIREALAGRFQATPDTVARLFATDRGEHLYGLGGVAERLEAGELVVSDRYLFSSLAYQGLTCDPALPEALNEAFPLPELLLYFTLAPEVAVGRMASRRELDIYENLAFQRRVAEAYESVIDSFEGLGMRIARIDAARSPDEVEEAVWAELEAIARRAPDRGAPYPTPRP